MKTYIKKTICENSSRVKNLIESFKKNGTKYRIRGRITNIEHAQSIYYELKVKATNHEHELNTTAISCYNDFRLKDEEVLNKYGIKIDFWEVYVY
jgi:hypothetical protein